MRATIALQWEAQCMGITRFPSKNTLLLQTGTGRHQDACKIKKRSLLQKAIATAKGCFTAGKRLYYSICLILRQMNESIQILPHATMPSDSPHS